MTQITWFKHYHGAASDPKWLAIADLAGSSPAIAWGTFSFALEYASEHEDRGSVAGLDPQTIASFYRVAVEEICRIFQVMRTKGMIVADRIAKWAKRQGAAAEKITKIVSAGAERVRRYRRKKAAAAREPELPGLAASVTAPVTAASEPVTAPVTSVSDKERDIESTPPVAPQAGGAPCVIYPQTKQGLMAIDGGRACGRRRETADERRMREFKEALARAGMAGRLERSGIAASASG